MSSKIFRTIFTLAALAAAPAVAQDVRVSEAQYNYATVRGWTVVALDERAGNIGCRARKVENRLPLMIERRMGEWNLIVPTRQQGVFQGGIVQVDGYVEDSQFGISNRYAIKTVNAALLAKLKAGAKVTVRVNGDGPLTFSLGGSTAAILKVQECDQLKGEAPQKTVQAAPAFPASPPPAMPAAPPQPGDTMTANCAPYASDPYACTATVVAPEAGYVEAFKITPDNRAAGNPAYFVKVRSDQNGADVWVAFSGSGWEYKGIWQMTDQAGGRCAEPMPQQTQQVRDSLGQDAWGLCVR